MNQSPPQGPPTNAITLDIGGETGPQTTAHEVELLEGYGCSWSSSLSITLQQGEFLHPETFLSAEVSKHI